MKVELHSNGKIRVILISETLIESAYLNTMLQSAAKGSSVKLEADGRLQAQGEEWRASAVVSMEV